MRQPCQAPRTADRIVPAITDPMGSHWTQPAGTKILLMEETATMDTATFKALHNYSCSVPSGVYPGKMWRSAENYHKQEITDVWYLRWFGESEDPKMCSNHHRRIIIDDTP